MRTRFLGLVVVCASWCLPQHAAAQFVQPRVLYLSHSAGFAHDSRLHAGDVIKALGVSSGGFSVTTTEDVGVLTAANLANYQAVVFFTSGELPINDSQKAALLEFVNSGKGFIGVHSATDTFHTTWPEYIAMIGGEFETHPWTQTATIRVEDQTHRSTQHLGASFAINDEIYQFKNWARANVHVLLSLDLASVPAQVPPPAPRMDNDYALAWTKSYGAGRVFYTALGHFDAVWDDVRFQKHVLEGIRWALGDFDLDADNDGLADGWELTFGLDRHSATGDNGPSGDPDHDGATNAQEHAAGTHPRGVTSLTRYLAEGSSNSFFDTTIGLANPGTTPALVNVRFLRSGDTPVTIPVTVGAQRHVTVRPFDIPGLQSADISTVVETDQEVVVERTMTWTRTGRFGSHSERAVNAPSTTWFLAEGATHGLFDTFYLFQNPSLTTDASVEVTFLRPDGLPPLVKTYDVSKNGRATVPVDAIPELAATDVSASIRVTSGPGIIVERAMYLSTNGTAFNGGHDSAGVTAPVRNWFFAEGATGGFFDMYLLLANPGTSPANVTVRYLLPGGVAPLSKVYPVLPTSRKTISVEGELPALADTAVSMVIDSDQPIVAERAMYWPPSWLETHNSPGATETGTAWAIAGGEQGGANAAQTYVLIANTSQAQGTARVTVLRENAAPLTRDFTLQPDSRTNVSIGDEFAAANNSRFGVLVETVGTTPVQIVVERATYSNDANGTVWAAGSNSLATKVR